MPDALIIAHGSPADPLPQEAAMQALAARYLASASPFRMAIIPEGQTLAQATRGAGANTARSDMVGR